MKKLRVSPLQRRGILALCVLGAGLSPLLVPTPAPAAPRQKLQLWPGQRVLLVLPLHVGSDWNAGPELAEAIQPLVRPLLQQALTATGKFSVTLPYRFDPILRRAVADKRVADDAVAALINTPSLETAQTVFSSLTFNQTPMVADVQLEELRIGGTPKKPTVQLQVSGKLYEVGGSGPFRNVVVTSRAFEGRTPEARLQAAANDAFVEIARQFVAPPEAFELPLPAAPTPAPGAAAMPGKKGTTDDAGMMGGANPAASSGTAPRTGMPNAPGTPNAMGAKAGGFVPVLPSAQPPLGIAVPQEPTLAR